MIKRLIGLSAFAATLLLSLISCQDEISPIGSSIFKGDVVINVDSTTFSFDAHTVPAIEIDSRSVTNLLGQINVPEYGQLKASYVTQLLAASSMNIPDSIKSDRVDSIKFLLSAQRSLIIGDSLAPQQFKIYGLTRQLPSSINSSFDPDGYYDPAKVLSSRNYTLSGISLSDSLFQKSRFIHIYAPIPREEGVRLFNTYRENPEVFSWPSTFNEKFPGLYVDSSFGKGAIANIISNKVMLYYHYYITRTVIENDEAVARRVTMKDSICLFTDAPEVLSSTNFSYKPSESLLAKIESGAQIITTPLGFHVNFKLPVNKILSEFWASDSNMKIINNLTLAIPASPVSNDYGLTAPPDLLMILTKDIEDFFKNGKVPDNKTSFRGVYSSSTGRYDFTSLRQYIVDLKNNKDNLTEEDFDFTLIPVEIQSESVDNYDGSKTVYITGCTPYIQKPSMVEIHTDKALVVFTFTSQILK